MAMSPFVDYVKIYFRSGNGGNGVVAWRREKFVPKGGPDGGDGGRGGDIFIQGNSQYWTLLDLKYRKYINAQNGGSGQGAKKKGKDGQDIILDVPLGTVAINSETDEIIGEVTENGQKILLAKGGRGGKGNFFFKTATHQAPEHAQPGTPGEEIAVVLELKMLADVGLVGFPNAGKSTLLGALSEAKPKVADYAFTTLVPNLGIVRYHDHQSFVMADIPGIIEGASEGRGLGTQFLRHIERNSVLLFMVACDAEDIQKEYHILENEVEQFNPDLKDKPRVLAITKCDMIDEGLEEEMSAQLQSLGLPIIFISAITNRRLTELKEMLWKEIQAPIIANDEEIESDEIKEDLEE